MSETAPARPDQPADGTPFAQPFEQSNLPSMTELGAKAQQLADAFNEVLEHSVIAVGDAFRTWLDETPEGQYVMALAREQLQREQDKP